MRLRILASLTAFANCAAADDAAFEFDTQREILVPPPVAAAEALIGAKFEPTKHELRVNDTLTTEKWEQGFLLHARLPLDEAFSIRQDIRTGLQTETVFGDALATTYRDALTLLEKTSAELRASEALRIAASIQQQWLANNQVPFAEIVAYGTEVVARPVQSITLKLQAEWHEREEFAGSTAEQQSYRLVIDEEFVPKKLKASACAGIVDSEDASGREVSERRWGALLFWSPDGDRTALTLGADFAEREITGGPENAIGADLDRVANYQVKLRQRFFLRSNVELQAGRELHPLNFTDGLPSVDAWNLGANSDFFLREELSAALGLRYRLRDEAAPADEFSLTLSIKGRF
jgi:hypothetical protein